MQIVGYETEPAGDSDRAALLLASDGQILRESLESGVELQYRLDDRHCAGVVDDGHHEVCRNESAPYCEYHTTRWACARCTGECTMPLPACHEEHAVYLAGFAPDTFKVGVTRSWRLQVRLREQGADRAAHIQTTADGRRARQLEAEIAREVGDRVRVSTKIQGLHRELDRNAWRSLLSEHDPIATFEFDYGFDLDEQPVAETIATGTVRGVQGRVLLLDHASTTYAVDLRNIVGYELTDGGTDRALQSSLARYGRG